MFIGASLLLADISTVITLTTALKKENAAFQTAASAENLPGESADQEGECCLFFFVFFFK